MLLMVDTSPASNMQGRTAVHGTKKLVLVLPLVNIYAASNGRERTAVHGTKILVTLCPQMVERERLSAGRSDEVT
jgi:hypothetical protein